MHVPIPAINEKKISGCMEALVGWDTWGPP